MNFKFLFYLVILSLFLSLFLSLLSCFPYEEDLKPEEKEKSYHSFISNLNSNCQNCKIRKKRSLINKVENPWKNTNWNKLTKDRILINIKKKLNIKKARNVILFIGDGMGVSTTSLARFYKAELKNLKKENIYMEWEKLKYTGLARTYNVDRSTPDSAGTATAYLCGVKGNMGTLGVNEYVKAKICSNMTSLNKLDSILTKFLKQGRSGGFVTTTRVTHASPAGSYANIPFRDWEYKVPENVECKDIAYQLINEEKNKEIRVIMGGGASNFLPENYTDSFTGKKGLRPDGVNLIKKWEEIKKNQGASYKVVRTRNQLQQLDLSTEYVFGLFGNSHMNYESDRNKTWEPSLAEMTEVSIDILNKNKNGFFLFVEGGRIDHGHHENKAQKALKDTFALEEALKKTLEKVDLEETLIVVTADHSHVVTMGGYGDMEESVLGFGAMEEPPLDHKPYQQIFYANGPGFNFHRGGVNETARINLNNTDVMDLNYQQDAGVWTRYETHGGEDVGIYSSGPWSHLFSSTEEQTYIAHVMMYASCVSDLLGGHCSLAIFVNSSIFLFFLSLSFLIL